MTNEKNTKRIAVSIDNELHRRLRYLCFDRDESVIEFVTRAIEERATRLEEERAPVGRRA